MTAGLSEEDIHETGPHRRLLIRCGPDRRRARPGGTGWGCHVSRGGSRQDEGGAAHQRERGIHGARDHELRSEEHTSELQSQSNLVCRLLLEKKKKQTKYPTLYYDTST